MARQAKDHLPRLKPRAWTVRYRRLHGSPQQDPTTNNGRPVGDAVTVAPRDGLFLVKIDDGR